MINPLQKFLLILFSVFLVTHSWADQLVVKTDRQQIEMGDILTLHVIADFQTYHDTPDLTVLHDQFEILGTQRSNQLQIINGKYTAMTNWQIQLLPKQAGELIIPPLNVGHVSSQPYKIQVAEINYSALNNAKLKSKLPFFMEADVSHEKPYVQSQVIYSLRFYFQGSVISGNIRPPQFDTAESDILQDQVSYRKNLNGVPFKVIEWTYAIHPQTAGKLTIAPAIFSGIISWNGRQKGVKEQSPELVLDVQKIPVEFSQKTNQAWLPASQLSLTQQFDQNPSQLNVGDTLTQTIKLSGLGLKSNQLLDLPVPNAKGIKVYPDQTKNHEQKDMTGFKSSRIFKRAIVLTAPGQFELPAQTLYWWNTDTDQLATLTLPATSIQVSSAQQTSTSQTLLNEVVGQTKVLSNTSTELNDQGFVSRETLWQTISLIFAVLWLLTLIIWRSHVQKYKRLPLIADTDEPINIEVDQQAWSSLTTLEKLPAKAFYQQLPKWLKQHLNVTNIAELNDEKLDQCFHQLNAHLYNQMPLADELIKDICDQLAQYKQATKVHKSHSELTPLYPTHKAHDQ